MSRTNRAVISAAFTYCQFAISMLLGLAVIKITLARVGSRDYGLWLTSGEVLGYAGLLDIGVFGLLPWLIAKADGEGDRAAIRSYVKHAVCIGVAVAVLYAGFFLVCWTLLPGLLKLSASDRHVLRAPLFLLVGAVSLTYPLKVLDATLIGLQDVKFMGVLSLIQLLATSAVELGMLYMGFGLLSLAMASTLNVAIAGSTGLWRVHKIAPDLLRDWPIFRVSELMRLIGDGTGVWFGSLGVQVMTASAGLILTSMHEPELTSLYAVTTKLAMIITQMSWVLPDSGLVGLSQLYGSADRDRVPGVVGRMLQFHLLLSTAAASALLSFNPPFVRVWVGAQFFAGFGFNALSALLIIVSSLMHGLICCAAVLGDRKRIGLITVSQAVVQLAAAIFLTRRFGLIGLPLGALIGQLAVPPVFTLILLRARVGLDIGTLIRGWLRIFILQVAPVTALAWFAGRISFALPIWQASAVQIVLTSLVVLLMWPVVRILLADPRVRGVITTFRGLRISPAR